MAAEADRGEGGNEQWKYTIYLVAFPGAVGYSEGENSTFNVANMIYHLVPEARVLQRHIIGGDAAAQSLDLDTDDEDDPIEEQQGREADGEGMRSVAVEATDMPAPDAVDKGEKCDGLDVETSEADNTGPVPFEAIEASVAEIEDSASVASVVTHQFSPASIEKEALVLLETIQQNAPTEKDADRSKVLLAGYGFGGIVVKQAVIIANTTPKYYDVALNISSLVFFATPHRSNNRQAWEEVLLGMIKATETSYRGRLSQILSGLVDSVSQLSHVFYRFAAKYPITNFTEGKGFGGDEPVVGRLGKFNNNLEEVVSWSDKDFNSLMFCAVDELDKLESLRIQFAPAHLSNQGISEHLDGASQVAINDAINDSYFETLQTLSPSRWILYETRTLEKPDDFTALKEIYRSLLKGIASKDVRAKDSIQVTGPPGYGKSALVKLISQEIRQRSSVVVIDNFLSSSERLPTLYGVHVSFLHQIISQRPSLFRPVRNLMVEILRQETWTEESLRILLAAILHHSRVVDFLIVIYDFEDWPSEIRSWWSETLRSLLKSCGSTFTFLTSSHRPINDLSSSKPHELDLEKNYGQYKKDFIKAKIDNLLNRGYGSVIFGKGLSDHVRKKIMSKAKSFQGSFTAINTHLVLLFQTFTLNTLEAIDGHIEASPKTEEELYESEIVPLQAEHFNVFFWVSSAISWMLWSVRPLRIEELAAAAAVNLDYSSMARVQQTVSMDMERDLQSHLGPIVAIENRYGRIASAAARRILSRDETRKSLELQNDCKLTKLCLHYIELILKDKKAETWEKCLSQVSWKHQTPAPRDPALEFLDYACRFWPTHFLLVKEPDKSLKDTVVKFLLAPKVGDRWFQLYLLCSARSANPLGGDQEAPGPATAVPEPELTMPEKNSVVGDKAKVDSPDKPADAQRLAVRMASDVGLVSIISELLDSSVPAKEPEMINVRRGYSERAVAFLDTGSRYYLDCAISNDDDGVVKRLLDSDRALVTKYFPLHKAALGGCLKTAQTLFNLLDNPAQIDQDGRTPLHLAAIGGSKKMIRFLLGKDVSDAHPRRTDVPNMIDIKDGNSQTPLIIASRMGNIEATKLLIESGADLAIWDGAGKTALHYAVLNCPEAVGDFADRDSAHIRDEDDCTPLHTAARSGSVETTSTLVSALHTFCRLFVAINAQDDQEKTPLHYAAENGYTEVVKILLNNEASTELGDKNDKQAAELAAARGHLATVKVFILAAKKIIRDRLLEAASGAGQLLVVQYLLRNKLASPDGDQSLDSRPLSLAASKGHNEVVRTLLRYNAAVNIEDATRQTPLHHAAKNGRYHVVRTLLNHQANTNQAANVNAPDIERNTPLHSAARAGQISVIELLLNHKANIEACSRTKETALHLAVRSPGAVEVLLNTGANPKAADMLSQTPLHMAVRVNCHKSAQLLLDWDANIDAQDDDGRPPLYYAITQDDLLMVKALRKDRPDLGDSPAEMEWAVESSALDVLRFLLSLSPETANKSDYRRATLLHNAAEKESLEVLTLLIQSGADVNFPGRWERTPLYFAANNGRVKNMRKLLESGAEVDKADENKKTPLHTAADLDYVEAVDVLLKANAAINKQDDRQQTPLYFAAFSGRVQIVKRLLQDRANVKLVNGDGWSPLHAGADNLEVTKLLVEHGADVNLPKEDLWTPLHLATYWSHPPIVKFLLENGASPNQANDSGNTGLHLALDQHNCEMVAAMLSHGAEVDRRNSDGSIPLHAAINCKRCGADMVQLLLDKGADFKIKTSEGLSCLSLAVGRDAQTLKVLLSAGSPSASGPIWDFEDMAAAYWRAIELDFPDCVSVLVKKEGRLLSEVSDKGFTGLETCLGNRSKRCEEEPLAVRLVELGADPFERRQVDRESCFELGIISRRAARLEFMSACMERVPEDVSSASGLGFKELRIATELDKPDLWGKLEPLREEASAVTDHDGWSLDHFIHQSAGRVPAQLRETPPPKSYKTPTGLVLRPMWVPPSEDIEARVQIAPNRLEVSFASDHRRGNASIICLRADFPFPPKPFSPGDLEPVYFEVTIRHAEHMAESESENSDVAPPTVTLGFCGEFCDQTQSHPGWNVWTVGYHGDDGHIFEEHSSGRYNTGHMFGPGDTVGCGIDYATEEYFFTREGEDVARYKSKVIFRKLYPAVSHKEGACKVKVNFGEGEFVWQREQKKEKEMQREYIEKWKREEAEKREKARREKEEEDAKFEARFKIQFMQAGYTEEQAEAVLKKKKIEKEKIEKEKKLQNTLAIDLSRPTWIKVKRKWLLPETLDHYSLPWEWDKDPEYIVIKQYVDQETQDRLFEHTLMLKERKMIVGPERDVTTLKVRDRSKDEMYLVRKKSKNPGRKTFIL